MNVKCGVEDFVLLSVYYRFYDVIKIIRFSFRICIHVVVDNLTKLVSNAIPNFSTKYIFVEQFFVLINPP